jgi:adenine C2-methylase RlmN of 23S rRNA A2503 and tRNA A37
VGSVEPLANHKRVIEAVHRIIAPAPDDELRDTLVPVNTRWKVSEVLEAARAYADQTGRRVSIEYALIR